MTTIVIGLAAVVVLILVVVVLALRYLRADDGDDFEDMPDERRQAHDSADGRGRRVAVRQPSRSMRPPHAARNADPRQAAGRAHLAARDMDRAGRYDARDHADDRGGQQSTAKYDDRRGSDSASKRHQESLPAVRPRPARGKRAEAEGDWPSTKWDQLSDVDYWAEVASDKPLTTTAQPAAPRPAQPGQPRDGQPGQPRDGEARRGGRAGSAPERNRPARLPVRGARPAAAAGPSPDAARAAEFVPAPHAAARAYPDSEKRPASASGGDSGLAALARRDPMPPGPPRPAVLDDDPLTSPSFPKIPAADSRSYRGGRADSPSSGSRSPAPYAAATQQFPTYASPSAQLDGYGTALRAPAPAAGYGTASRQSAAGYGEPARQPADVLGQPGRVAADHASSPLYQPAPLPGPGGSPSYGGRAEPAGPHAGADGYHYSGHLPPASSAVPVPVPAQDAASGNPYGSYVSPPVGSYLPTSQAESYLPSPPAGSYLPSPPAESYLPSTQATPPDSGRPVSGHNGHAAGSGSHRANSFSQPAVPYEASAAPYEASAALDGPSSGWYPDLAAPVPPTSAYLDVSRQMPSLGIPAGSHLNGNGHAEPAGYPAGQHEPSGYLPSGYNGIPHDPSGYAGPDPYGRDPYGGDPYGRDPHGYPGYGSADI